MTAARPARHERAHRRRASVVKRKDRMFLQACCTAAARRLHARQGHFSCRMYAERPTPCRVVEPGGRECRDARRRRGIGDGD